MTVAIFIFGLYISWQMGFKAGAKYALKLAYDDTNNEKGD